MSTDNVHLAALTAPNDSFCCDNISRNLQTLNTCQRFLANKKCSILICMYCTLSLWLAAMSLLENLPCFYHSLLPELVFV